MAHGLRFGPGPGFLIRRNQIQKRIVEADGARSGPQVALHSNHSFGETNIPKVSQPEESTSPMGDKSPKSTQKKASQKQSKNDASAQKKQSLVTSQQATKAKAAAAKKK